MSRLDEATENPNDRMPKGKPLDPDVIVPDGDAGMVDENELTETEKVNRKEAQLPNGGRSPDYNDDSKQPGIPANWSQS